MTVMSVVTHKDNRLQKTDTYKSFHNSGLYQFLYMIVPKYEYSKLEHTPLDYIHSCLSYLPYHNFTFICILKKKTLLTSTNITT
jgi:hypothetical protein